LNLFSDNDNVVGDFKLMTVAVGWTWNDKVQSCNVVQFSLVLGQCKRKPNIGCI